MPVLDSGARGSTITFAQRGIGHVLIAWENEAYYLVEEMGKDKFEIVTPSISILAEPSVAVVDKNVDKHGTRAAAEAYLEFLYTPEGPGDRGEALLPAARRGGREAPRSQLREGHAGHHRRRVRRLAEGAEGALRRRRRRSTRSTSRAHEHGGGPPRDARPPARGRAQPRRAARLPAVARLHADVLSLLVLIPLAGLVLKSADLGWPDSGRRSPSPRALAAYRLTFGAAFAAAAVNVVFGLVVGLGAGPLRVPGQGRRRRAGRPAVRAADRGRRASR